MTHAHSAACMNASALSSRQSAVASYNDAPHTTVICAEVASHGFVLFAWLHNIGMTWVNTKCGQSLPPAGCRCPLHSCLWLLGAPSGTGCCGKSWPALCNKLFLGLSEKTGKHSDKGLQRRKGLGIFSIKCQGAKTTHENPMKLQYSNMAVLWHAIC